MSTQHTPTPWEIYQNEISYISKHDDQSFGMRCPVDLSNDYIMHRIVACVNACAGIQTEYLTGGIEVPYKNECEGLKQQRDELQAKCDGLVAALHEGRRAIGDHNAPNDCYATGPLTGNPILDFVQCPACSFIGEYERITAAQPARGSV